MGWRGIMLCIIFSRKYRFVSCLIFCCGDFVNLNLVPSCVLLCGDVDNAEEATEHLKAFIGDHYLYSDKPIFKILWDNYKACQFVDDEGAYPKLRNRILLIHPCR
jgi:hypothetical protein